MKYAILEQKQMITNPFLPAPSEANAWAEGFTKGFTALSSPEPSDKVAEEDVDAFNQGVAAGAQSAQTGIALDDPCIAAVEEHGPLHDPSVAINAAEIAHGLWEARHLKTLAGGVAGILVAFVELACTLPVHLRPPEEELPRMGQQIIDVLMSYGLDAIELFCGAGLDINAPDCEILVSPLFTTLNQAREAAIAMNRPQWVVGRWQTRAAIARNEQMDQAGRFEIVDSGTL